VRFVILVPWRPDPRDERRQLLWDWTRPYLEEIGPITTAGCEGRWQRAVACNRAARAAGDWDVALVADSDTIPEPGSIERAIDWVRSTGGGCRPHLDRYLLNREGTLRFAQRGIAGLEPQHVDHTWPGGGLLVLTREAYEKAGGYDENFVGWGWEDTAMNLALMRTSRFDRLPSKAWHLWHQPQRARPQSVQRMNEMMQEHAALVDAWLSNQRGYELGRAAI